MIERERAVVETTCDGWPIRYVLTECEHSTSDEPHYTERIDWQGMVPVP